MSLAPITIINKKYPNTYHKSAFSQETYKTPFNSKPTRVCSVTSNNNDEMKISLSQYPS